MVKITINGKTVNIEDGKSILQAARENGYIIPSLCYLKDINEAAACRVCVVEVEGSDRLVPSCATKVEEGMVIYTNSPRVIRARKTNVRLILSSHESNCPYCSRNMNCTLQNLSSEMDILYRTYEKKYHEDEWDHALPIIRHSSKCINCMRCVNICHKVQGMDIWDLLGTGSHAGVRVREGKKLNEVNCTYCGQCITHCPVGALRERDDSMKLFEPINDPEKIVVLQVAPAVRAAWGAGIGLTPEEATEKRMAAAFRAMGVDYVFDTNFSADLTIMEEANEFLKKLSHPESFKKPMFTSCCPGWVRFLKLEYPELVPQLSTAKSPQQMFGAIAKTYFATSEGIDPENIYCVSIMPCTAKKYESNVSEVNDSGAEKDVDAVLTTREVDRLIKMMGINVKMLKKEEFDSPLGTGSGAGVIFGATGGVMEAALRTAYYATEGRNPRPDAFEAVRGLDGRKELTVTLAGTQIKACVASGLANARNVVEDIISGKAEYDFVEIMACPGGCAGGGGQPISDGLELAGERGEILYKLDAANEIRFSHENPSVLQLYKDYLGEPLSEKAHHLLHTEQKSWKL